MKISLTYISPERWQTYEGLAHAAVFEKILPPEYERISFALLAVNAADDPVAYLTARELDKESVYLKYGGAFPPIRGSYPVFSVYVQMLNSLKDRYRRLTTLVENTNTAYLKLALSAGWQIIGLRNFKGSILVELLLEG